MRKKIIFELPDDLDAFELLYEEDKHVFKVMAGKRTKRGAMFQEWKIISHSEVLRGDVDLTEFVNPLLDRLYKAVEAANPPPKKRPFLGLSFFSASEMKHIFKD